MGRIARGVCGLLLALGLFSFPVTARASDGFLGGLEDLTGTRQVETQQKGYEESYSEGYEPELREVVSTTVRTLPEDATTVDYVNNTLDSFNNVGYGSGNVPISLLNMVRILLGGNGNYGLSTTMRNEWLLIVVGIVFLWWGVRKSKNMIMKAFRKGKASI